MPGQTAHADKTTALTSPRSVRRAKGFLHLLPQLSIHAYLSWTLVVTIRVLVLPTPSPKDTATHRYIYCHVWGCVNQLGIRLVGYLVQFMSKTWAKKAKKNIDQKSAVLNSGFVLVRLQFFAWQTAI
jgi:hypothetical protein